MRGDIERVRLRGWNKWVVKRRHKGTDDRKVGRRREEDRDAGTEGADRVGRKVRGRKGQSYTKRGRGKQRVRRREERSSVTSLSPSVRPPIHSSVTAFCPSLSSHLSLYPSPTQAFLQSIPLPLSQPQIG